MRTAAVRQLLVFAAYPATFAALLALALARFPAGALPQRTSGADALSVAFGDAKAVLSDALVRKADSYFHGGAEMAATLEEDGQGDHGHGEGCDCGHDHGHGEGAAGRRSFADPWRWINAHVHAPPAVRHLSARESVELVPWLWASVRANPRNVEAWTTALYVAARVMRDDALFRRVAAEAKAKNPDSPEILLAEGRYLYRMGKGDVQGARAAFVRARELLLRDGEESLSEDGRMNLKAVNAYLGAMDAAPAARP